MSANVSTIKWLVDLKPDKLILALLLIGMSVLWTTGLIEKRSMQKSIDTKTQEVIKANEKVTECQEYYAKLFEDLYLDVQNINTRTQDIDNTTKKVENAAKYNNKKLKKLLKDEEHN